MPRNRRALGRCGYPGRGSGAPCPAVTVPVADDSVVARLLVLLPHLIPLPPLEVNLGTLGKNSHRRRGVL